jgi:hypothetical protein
MGHIHKRFGQTLVWKLEDMPSQSELTFLGKGKKNFSFHFKHYNL